MNRNDDTSPTPAPVAEIGDTERGALPARTLVGKGDGPVDHDPTLKWIIPHSVEAGGRTPPPLSEPSNSPLLPAIQISTKEKRALAPEPAASIRTPPPLPTGSAEVKTPPPEPRTPPPQQESLSPQSKQPVVTSDQEHLTDSLRGATPADFLVADPTPPPPSRNTPANSVGAAPASVLPDSAGSDGELSADAVELLPMAADETGPTSPAMTPNEPTTQEAPQAAIHVGSTVAAPTTDASTEPREVEPDAVEMLEAPPSPPEIPPEPREVEPDAVEMLESAEHLTATPAGEKKPPTPPTSAPPPVPTEPAPPAARPPRPATIAAALFDEHQTPISGGETIPEALARRSLKKRAKPWYEEVFDEDFLRTLPFMTPEQTAREVAFIREALSPPSGGEVLDVGCGYGRHALELAQQGLQMTGLDLSLPMLIRAADHAQKRGLAVNFVHADMREMTFDSQFDAAYCMLSSFGYFDEETNVRVATAICRALKPGGRFLLDIINRDYIVRDLPSRVWWEGDGCVVLEEVDFNYHTSRVLIRRSVVFGNGRQSEQEISLRAYSLHEVGKLLRQAGLRVLDVSGGLATKSRFYGAASRNIIAICERPSP